MRVANELVNNGYVTGRPNFGITVSDSIGYEYITDEYGRRIRVETSMGARIEAVGKGSCAEKAGIRVGDVVTKLGDLKIDTANTLINAKNAYKAGDSVSVEIYRNGETLTLTVVFDEYIPQN
jgi:serine protease Do